jgi:hypothetical protein
MALTTCYNCEYLSKRPGTGNYFIYKCSYWGLVTQNIIPSSVVFNSIGKKCPFFLQKMKINKKKNNDTPKDDKDGLDIVI